MKQRLSLALAIGSMLATACAPTISTRPPSRPPRNSLEIDPTETRHCLRLATGFEEDRDVVGPARPTATESRIPPGILRTARAAGIEHVLEILVADATPGERSVEKRLELFTRLSSLEIQLGALLFEADCVGDQMEAAIAKLDDRQRRQEISLAAASIILGAAAAIGGGLYEIRGHAAIGIPVIGIVGGVAAAGLGIGAFARARVPVTYRHPRNLLRPILSAEDPDGLYPRFVFRMLTEPPADGGASPRDALLEDWRHILADLPESRRAIAEQILYGNGGVYDTDLVATREQMFDALESHLHSIERELELLYRYADRVIAEPSTAEP